MKLSDITDADYNHARRTLRAAVHELRIRDAAMNKIVKLNPQAVALTAYDFQQPGPEWEMLGKFPFMFSGTVDEPVVWVTDKIKPNMKTYILTLIKNTERAKARRDAADTELDKVRRARSKNVYVVGARDLTERFPSWWCIEASSDATVYGYLHVPNIWFNIVHHLTDRKPVLGFKMLSDAESMKAVLEGSIKADKVYLVPSVKYEVKVAKVPVSRIRVKYEEAVAALNKDSDESK